MATRAQIDANRENAKKSTGPKTAEGKRVASQNALKHGLFAHEAVIRGESHAEYELHREVLLDEWRPVGPTECMLAERIVSLSWRLQRAELMQNEAMDCMILRHVVGETDSELDRACRKAYGVSPDELPDSREYLALGRIATERRSDNAKLIERLFMHERRIESSLNRTMKLLKKLQIMRRIEYDAAERTDAQDHVAEHQPPPESPPAQAHDGDFAKQSQFVTASMDTTSCAAKAYDETPPAGQHENKANQARPERGRTGQSGQRHTPRSRECSPNLPRQSLIKKRTAARKADVAKVFRE